MKFLFAIVTGFMLLFQSASLETVRSKYSTAYTSKATADSFAKLVSGAESSSTLNGYKAAAKIVQAKFAVGEGRKKLITSGANTLEGIIKNDPSNVELRVVRMSVQESLPKFIKYDKNLAGDKKYIISKYSAQNSSLKSYIKKFASQSKSFTAAERASLK